MMSRRHLIDSVKGSSGISETDFIVLGDETRITDDEFLQLNASIKVHLSASGPGKDMMLHNVKANS
jgi:hypothetical protein